MQQLITYSLHQVRRAGLCSGSHTAAPDSQEIQVRHCYGNCWCWSWNSNIWPPDANSQLIGKDPDAGKDWRQKEKWTTEEMIGWHHWCNGHQLGQTLGDDEGQGRLACSPWGCEESDTTWQLSKQTCMSTDPSSLDIICKCCLACRSSRPVQGEQAPVLPVPTGGSRQDRC